MAVGGERISESPVHRPAPSVCGMPGLRLWRNLQAGTPAGPWPAQVRRLRMCLPGTDGFLSVWRGVWEGDFDWLPDGFLGP